MTAQPIATDTISPRARLIAACDAVSVPADARRAILRLRVERNARSGYSEYMARKGH